MIGFREGLPFDVVNQGFWVLARVASQSAKLNISPLPRDRNRKVWGQVGQECRVVQAAMPRGHRATLPQGFEASGLGRGVGSSPESGWVVSLDSFDNVFGRHMVVVVVMWLVAKGHNIAGSVVNEELGHILLGFGLMRAQLPIRKMADIVLRAKNSGRRLEFLNTFWVIAGS